MIKKEWHIRLEDKEYNLEVIPNNLFRRFKIILDGAKIKPKENYVTKRGNLLKFNIGENTIIIFVENKGWQKFEYDLYINNRSIETGHEFSSPEELEKLKFTFTDFAFEFFKFSISGAFGDNSTKYVSQNLIHTDNAVIESVIFFICFSATYYLINLIIEKIRTKS